jgi:hypothetical protein
MHTHDLLFQVRLISVWQGNTELQDRFAAVVPESLDGLSLQAATVAGQVYSELQAAFSLYGRK